MVRGLGAWCSCGVLMVMSLEDQRMYTVLGIQYTILAHAGILNSESWVVVVMIVVEAVVFVKMVVPQWR